MVSQYFFKISRIDCEETYSSPEITFEKSSYISLPFIEIIIIHINKKFSNKLISEKLYKLIHIKITLIEKNGRKNMLKPIIGAVLSFLVPGLGQIIANKYKTGVIFLVIWILLGVIATFIFQHWIVRIIDLLFCIFAAYDAYVRLR